MKLNKNLPDTPEIERDFTFIAEPGRNVPSLESMFQSRNLFRTRKPIQTGSVTPTGYMEVNVNGTLMKVAVEAI